MNIQIFGKSKCFDTKKAQRYFSERNIKYQYVDISEKSMSRGEFQNVKKALGGLLKMIDMNASDQDGLLLIKYAKDEDKEEKLLLNQKFLVTPIVRNGKQATAGFCPDVWKTWREE
jgi:arsenate reductase-like glutaredoxin family protein